MADNSLTLARATTLFGSVLTALSSGTNYVFSAYAPQLAARLHITHTQLNIIGLSGNMGVYTTGPLVGYLTDKRGPRPLLISAVLLLFTGYIGLRAYYNAGPSNSEKLPLTTLISMSFFSYMTGVGGSSGITASVNATAKSFSDSMRATTVGLVVSGFGLSAFFFATLASWIIPGDTSSFLLLLALGTAIPITIGILTVRPILHVEHPATGPDGLTDSLMANSSTHLLGHDHLSGEGGAGEPAGHSRSPSIELSPARNSIVGRCAPSLRRPVAWTKLHAHKDSVDIHGLRMLSGWEFWLLFMILSLLSGTGIMFINNVGSISQALYAKGDPKFDRIKAGKLQAAQVSIISLANCAGRVAIGMGADFAKNRFGMHRSYLLSLISTLLTISQIVGSRVENVNHLWQASVILGLGYGAAFGLLPTITIEWFGLSHFSENWGFVTLAPFLGGNIFSILFGRNLDAHVPLPDDAIHLRFLSSRSAQYIRAAPPDDAVEHQCLEGRSCYADAMLITTFACVFALILSLIAAWRDWRLARTEVKYGHVEQVIWEQEDEG